MNTLIVITKKGCPACDALKQVRPELGISLLGQIKEVAKTYGTSVEEVYIEAFHGTGNTTGLPQPQPKRKISLTPEQQLRNAHPDLFNVLKKTGGQVPCFLLVPSEEWNYKTIPLRYVPTKGVPNLDFMKKWLDFHRNAFSPLPLTAISKNEVEKGKKGEKTEKQNFVDSKIPTVASIKRTKIPLHSNK